MDVTILDNTGLVLGVGLALLAALIAGVWAVTQRARRENMDQMARITDMAEALARQQEDMVRQQSMLSGALQQSQATVI